MADEPLFTKIAHGAPANITGPKIMAAKEWFKDNVQKITDQKPGKLFEQADKNMTEDINISSVGSLFSFVYDPKWKEKLPYYDVFPLAFIIEIYNDGFLGLNLHYLSPYYRAKLMNSLYGITIKYKDEEESGKGRTKGKTIKDMMKLQVNYQLLKSASKFGLFQHCIKRYLANHVKSRYMFIDPDKWDTAVLLPTQKFIKASEETVWRDTAGLGPKK